MDKLDFIKEHFGFLAHNDIKVDILISSNFSKSCHIDSSREIFSADIYVEDIKDILAKKIAFRSDQNKTRDIIDIAVSLSHDKNIMKEMVQSGLIKSDDLLILKKSLHALNREKFACETDIVEPLGEYRGIADVAPEMIKSEIDLIIREF